MFSTSCKSWENSHSKQWHGAVQSPVNDVSYLCYRLYWRRNHMTTVPWTNAEVVSSVQQTTRLLQAVPYLLLARFMVDCVTYLWNIITVYHLPLVLSTRTAPVNSWPEKRKRRRRLCHNKSPAAPATLGPALLHTTVTLIIASMNMSSSRLQSLFFCTVHWDGDHMSQVSALKLGVIKLRLCFE